ncbi:hypothetical protein DFJ58DRAFT_409983 [Suillus subalutaceus]|uniref:uncharacterized protein n=1 Tax=Suillus subalutaceus TaxID=48586 RepID=UPI001B86BF96|nr:uncharacterized protein DFJ58DRAFT_409983 [Suillus subalutaceus]KAG1873072.1 hypothetical protein DFJ58DRAFT_409983 [Suillus subalutaceus]
MIVVPRLLVDRHRTLYAPSDKSAVDFKSVPILAAASEIPRHRSTISTSIRYRRSNEQAMRRSLTAALLIAPIITVSYTYQLTLIAVYPQKIKLLSTTVRLVQILHAISTVSSMLSDPSQAPYLRSNTMYPTLPLSSQAADSVTSPCSKPKICPSASS